MKRNSLLVCPMVAGSFCLLLLATGSLVSAQQDVSSGEAARQAEDQAQVRVYFLRFAAANDAQQVLQTVLAGSENVRLGVDERVNSIIVMGPRETHEQVEALLKLLDQPSAEVAPLEQRARNVQVEVFWVADVSLFDLDATDLPDSINAAVIGIKDRLEIGDPKLVSRLFVQTLVDPQLQNQGIIQARGLSGSKDDPTILECNGAIQSHRDGGYRMELSIHILMDGMSSEVESTLLAKPGRPICLGLADTTSLKSLFVVLVTEDE